tara:strand:+ start:134 stop:709 length:576 start_codon:yes stop_codon:yes gene_type:complete
MYKLAIFQNEKEKIFHIWITTQKKYLQNVNVTNLYSKAKYALMGKDSSQAAASSSLFRVAAATNRKDWTVEYVELNLLNTKEVKSQALLYEEMLIDEKYIPISRHPRYRTKSGKYTNKKSRVTLIKNLTRPKVVENAIKMLEDLLIKDFSVIKKASNKIATDVLSIESSIENISQMWSYVESRYNNELFRR